MGKRTYFLGFLTLIVSISLLAFACSKKQDADKPAQPPDSNTSSESNSPAPLELPLAEGRITAQTEANSPEPELTKAEPASPATPGLILAIAYSDKPAVLIGDALLSEGDTIRGVKVIKINRETVEFEKNGSRWTQQAGETPPVYWADPNS